MSQDDYSEIKARKLALIETLIAGLVEARDKAHPKGGDETAKGKDLAAFGALMQAGRLTKAVAQWAIDHQIGLALEELEFVPLVPQKTKRLPQYIEARSNVDSHRHEIAGRETSYDTLTTEQRRAVAISLLRANVGGFPHGIAQELCEALESVSSGKLAPILKPPTTYRKAGLLRMREELNAVCFALFRSGTKIVSSTDAWNQIAAEYGVSTSTLRGWRVAARQEFGTVSVSSKEEKAENAASHIAAIRNSNLSRAVTMLRNDYNFGEEALKKSVERHRALLQNETEKKARGKRRSLRAARSL